MFKTQELLTYFKVTVIIVTLPFLVNCSDDSEPSADAAAVASSDTAGISGEGGGDGPTVSLSVAANVSAGHLFKMTESLYIRASNTSENTWICLADAVTAPDNCENSSNFNKLTAGSFNSSTGTYTISYQAVSDMASTGVYYIYLRNGGATGDISEGYYAIFGIVPTVSVAGASNYGAFVDGDFSIWVYGVSLTDAQWCMVDIAFESPDKCGEDSAFLDIEPDTWTYNEEAYSVALGFSYEDLPKTTYKVVFRDKATGVRSYEMVIAVQ